MNATEKQVKFKFPSKLYDCEEVVFDVIASDTSVEVLLDGKDVLKSISPFLKGAINRMAINELLKGRDSK
jgi:hypothetical protein